MTYLWIPALGPPPFSPCRPRERAQDCQKSLADVYRTGLTISHGALWYLIYIRPDMGELKGLFWDIPHRWIWFLQLEQFPKYVPPSRFWSVLAVNGQSLVLHTFSRHVFILFRKHSCKVFAECTAVHLDPSAVKKRQSTQIIILYLFSVDVLLLVSKAGSNACAREHLNISCNKIQYKFLDLVS